MVAKAAQIPGKTAEILNARDQHGNTALHYLAQNEIGLVALRAIVDAGGDISVRNKKKLTPLNIAMNNGCTRVIKILSTAEKNSRHSSHYDSSIYTTDSPPESPVNAESLENSQDEQFHVDHPYSLPKDSSSHDTDTPALECTEDSSFNTNEEEASDEVPSGVTEDEVPPGASDKAHSDKPSDAPSSDIDDPSSCVTSDPPADVTDDGPSGVTGDAPSGVRDNAPCGATNATPGVANNAPSSITENAPSEVRDESSSNATDDPLAGIKDNTPNGDTDNTHAGVSDNAPAGVPDNAPAGVTDNAPAGVTDYAPAGITDETSSVTTDNTHCGTRDVPSGHSTTEETPPAAYDEPDEETDSVLSEYGDETASNNEGELADHGAACGSNAIGVQTPGIDPYSCIVHIKQEILSPVSVICFFFY